MVEPLSARQTLDRALALMASGRGTSLPELLRVIETLSLNVCEVTVSELGEIIEKDTVIVARVIAAANTIAHNPTISPLTTLSQAIHRLGYTRIRTIAVALMLLDTAGGSNPPEQREAAAQALCAGLLAQASAQEVGTHDPELVFACAAMRNFGYIMSAAVSVEHCRLAQQQTGGNLAEAYQAQFGIAPLELARRLLTAARLPAEVIETLRDCEPGSPTAESSNFENRLLALAEYGTRLAHLTLESTQNPERFADAVRNLGEQFAALLPGAAEFAPRALGGANQRLSDFTVAHGMRGLPTKSLQRVRWRLHQMTETEPADPASAAAPEAPVARPPRPAPPKAGPRAPSGPPSARPAAALRPDRLVLPAMPSAAAPLAEVLAACEAHECWIFGREPGKRDLSLLHAIGDTSDRPPRHAHIAPGERSVFGVCLERGEIACIHDAGTTPHLPAWYRCHLSAPAAFAVIPLGPTPDARVLLLVGWHSPRRVNLTPQQIGLSRHALAAVAERPDPQPAGPYHHN